VASSRDLLIIGVRGRKVSAASSSKIDTTSRAVWSITDYAKGEEPAKTVCDNPRVTSRQQRGA
jgi:hypothetical protein